MRTTRSAATAGSCDYGARNFSRRKIAIVVDSRRNKLPRDFQAELAARLLHLRADVGYVDDVAATALMARSDRHRVIRIFGGDVVERTVRLQVRDFLAT
jgi:hypothetical protein